MLSPNAFCRCHVESKGGRTRRVKRQWEIIADNLKKRGWSLGWVSAVDCNGRTIWIADAHRDEKRFVVRADEKLTAFLELESAIRKNSIDTLGAVWQSRARVKSGRYLPWSVPGPLSAGLTVSEGLVHTTNQ